MDMGFTKNDILISNVENIRFDPIQLGMWLI